MNLKFNTDIAKEYTSSSQKIRVLTEDWVNNHIYCPNCGCDYLKRYENNRPVADFYCSDCEEDFELKSKKDSLGMKIMDGAYNKKMERLKGNNNPNLFVLNYDVNNYAVNNFLVIPKYYFVPDIIEKRKPLSPTAERHDWVGSNILLGEIPQNGKVSFIENRIVKSKKEVLSFWKKTLFLKEEKLATSKGWILDIMNCIDRLKKREFNLDEIYSFENMLKEKHPDNKHVKDKIRQQLQYLRDRKYLKFVGNGNYKLI